MNQRLVQQLDKVLALADSSHEGEAVGAVRMARQMLERDGLCFSDLAKAAATNRARLPLSRALFSGQTMHLEAQITQLRHIIEDLRADNHNQATQVDFWRRRALEMEQQMNVNQSEAQRWRNLARETAEKLWDISRLAHAVAPPDDQADDSDAFPASSPAANAS
jgi:hypothetical protein